MTSASEAGSGAPDQVAARLTGEADEHFDEAAQRRVEPVQGSTLNNRFKLDSVLATGNRGIVYGATDLQQFEGDLPARRLAVKLLKSARQADPEAVHRFRRSCQIAQSMNHPNLLKVFDIDVDRNTGASYLTMEQLAGSSLRRRLNASSSRKLGKQEALRIIRGLCVGLMHVHSKGYIHADVRPETVFVTSQQRAVLVNFERAALATHAGLQLHGRTLKSMRSEATEENSRHHYTSPQIKAGYNPHRSDDVYSLACVCYEIFSGHRPDNPPAPVPGLSRRHWKALQHALAPERNRRTRGISAFAQEMGVVQAHNSKRRRLLWALGAANAAVLAGLVFFGMAALLSPDDRSGGSPSAIAAGQAAQGQDAVAQVAAAPVEQPSFTLDTDSYRVGENRRTARLKVTRSGDASENAAILWWTEAGTAEPGKDYGDLGKTTLEFFGGRTEQWIFVPVVADSVKESVETFYVHIGNPSEGFTLGEIQRAAVHIENMDP